MELKKDFIEFIELLNREKVKYLILGGYAVAFSKEDLLKNKKATGRVKDKPDIARLEKQ